MARGVTDAAAAPTAEVRPSDGTRATAEVRPQGGTRATGGVRAHARITAAPDARGGTALPELAGDGPIALRRVRAGAGEARVCLVGAMAGPLGGDRVRLDVRVEAGAALRVTSAAATLALPGTAGEPARYDVSLAVGDGAELHWLPEPLVSVRGSRLHATYRIDLAPTARLVFREEQVLGRTGEPPGRLVSRLTVRSGGRPLLDQATDYGPGAPAWDGPAVLADNRATGQLLVAAPGFAATPAKPHVLAPAQAALTPLPGPAALTTAVAPDALRLRTLLDEARTHTTAAYEAR
ncbi:urease accessory protein UreD [Streptomyces synnematoformans]|uniref:Urease accessory protein UreD n=1 Tax=Streptomyces synnematoformans TaxID=415721 RepID=A0ABN2XPR5_9ACTN